LPPRRASDSGRKAHRLTYALSIPETADRPLWDKNRRLVIKEDLAKIEGKS
jgi:hypothetical protein